MDRVWVELIEAAVRRPSGVATVFPTSRALAGRMARAAAAAPEGPVVELGAGSGAITRFLVSAVRGPLTALELDPGLARFLQTEFPTVKVACASAEDLGRFAPAGTLGAVVSSLPWTLLDTVPRERILGAVRTALQPEGVFVTYLCLNALVYPQARSFLKRVRAHFGQVDEAVVEWRNVPPARLIVARPGR